MAPIIRPHERTLNVKKTSAIEVASGATNWQALHALDLTLDPGSSLVDENEMGGVRHNAVDPTQQVLGLPNPSWNANVVFDLNQIGWWLRSLAGGVTSEEDGETGVYDHVFTSGGQAPGLLHIENRLAAGLFTFGDSLAVSQMVFNFADEDGSRKIQLSGVGRSVRTPVVTGVSETPAAAPARAKVPGGKGLLKVNGSNYADIVGGNCTLGNGAYTERYFDDSEWPGAIECGMPSAGAAPELRVRNDMATRLATFDGITPFDAELIFQLTADLRLSIVFPQVVANPVTPRPSGANAMSVTPSFMASQTDAASMWTATLRNAIAAY
jgi:hypothetical protein